MAASHMNAGLSPVAPLLIQLADNDHGKQWTTTPTNEEDLIKPLTPGFGLLQFWLLGSFGD